QNIIPKNILSRAKPPFWKLIHSKPSPHSKPPTHTQTLCRRPSTTSTVCFHCRRRRLPTPKEPRARSQSFGNPGPSVVNVHLHSKKPIRNPPHTETLCRWPFTTPTVCFHCCRQRLPTPKDPPRAKSIF
ncbi:hypothetical protein Csa_023752, partial [Cucumis sativus]